MDGILSIFQGIAKADAESLDIYLNAINEHQSFRLKGSSGSDPVVQHITSVLSKPATRYEGLYLLNKYLEQCSVDVLEQKGVHWMTLVIKSCNSKEAENVGSMAYIVLKTLAVKSVGIVDICKAFVSNVLTKIYESLSTVLPCAYLAALECVETCLRLYPGPSGPSRGSIEKFIFKFTDVTDGSLVLWSGKCLHLLQQVRGGGVQGISHKAAWQSYQMKLLGSLHNVLDLAFANCTELFDDHVEKEQLNVAQLELSDEPVRRAMQIYIRFKNLLNYLVSALRQPFPVSKAIAPKKILNLITRGLGVTCQMIEKNKISDNLAIGALLPQMQVHLFELLDATILILKSNLIMYHAQILAFVFDTLKWTSSKKSRGHQKPYSHLRSAAYRTLTLWCNTMKHGSRCEIIAEGIINEIIFDITPFENEFTLKVLSGGKKHMSKKARRQLHKAQNEQSNLAQQHSNPSDSQAKKELFSDEGNQKLCVVALQSLSSVFLSSGCFLKPTVVKSCHLKIVSISLAITDATPKNYHLYSNYLCRLELYNALQSFIVSPHHLCPPPTQMTVKLLQTAQIKDANVFVRDACSMILNNLEKVIHPQKESLVFPPDIRDIRNAFHKVGKEKLLAAQPNGQVMDEEDDSEEEDETSGEESDDMEVEKNDEPKRTGQAPETSEIAVNIDLTLDDCNTREAIHLESSNDSVEFVREETPQPSDSDHLKMKNKRINEQQKSPEITLRVEEEEEDEEEAIEGINQAENVTNKLEEPINQIINPQIEILSNGKINQLDYEPSSPKRPRLEEVEPMNVTDNIEKAASIDKDTENLNTENNETSFEDIAAAFVDELN